MSEEHSKIQDDIEKMLKMLGYNTEQEYTDKILQGKKIDVVAFNNKNVPFIGIEIHIEGDLDNDLKKLLDYPLSYRVIITPDRNLVEIGKKGWGNVEWFLVPSEYEKGFENFVRKLKGVSDDFPYYFNRNREFIEIIDISEKLKKIKELFKTNNLNYDVACDIIYTGIVSGGDVPYESMDTNEYKYLQSLGITAGLDLYWDFMEWGNELKFSSEGVQTPIGIKSYKRKKGEPLAFEGWKDLLTDIAKDKISRKSSELLSFSREYSDVFNEIALIGKQGTFSIPEEHYNYFTDIGYDAPWEMGLGLDHKYIPPTQIARIQTLASNPFLNDKFFLYGRRLIDIGLAVEIKHRLIRTLYRPIAEAIKCIGAIEKRTEEVNDYLSWWILYRGGTARRNMVQYSNILNIPWDKIETYIEITYSMGLTSKYIPDNAGLRKIGQSINPFWNPIGTDISVFKEKEFSDFCKQNLRDALERVIR